MQLKEWSATEWSLLIFNVIALSIAIWLLRRKLLSKLNEIEDRQNQSAARRRSTVSTISEESDIFE